MKKTYFLYLFCLTICSFACKKYETQHEGAWNDSKAKPNLALHVIRNIVYATTNGVWTTDGRNAPKHLVTDLVSTITRVSISPKYDKIAYQKTTGEITVVDSNGIVLANNINMAGVTHFEWHHNNNLLYGTQNTPTVKRVTTIYGGILPPVLPVATFNTTSESLNFCYITKENDIFYSVLLEGSYVRFIYKQSGSTTLNQTANYYQHDLPPVDIRFANNNLNGVAFNKLNASDRYGYNVTLQDRAFYISSHDYESFTAIYLAYNEYVTNFLGLKYFFKNDVDCNNGCLIANTNVFDIK
jgi:hypothetical protein